MRCFKNCLTIIMLAWLFVGLAPVLSNDRGQAGELFPDATWIGTNDNERCGYSVAGAGDVNGDGFDDFMVAAYHNYVHGWNSGGVYLIAGHLNADWGFGHSLEDAATAIFRGSHEYDMVGYNVAGKGDFNGDGLDDLIIGAPGSWDREPPTPGWVYLVFGRKDLSWGNDFLLASHADVKIQGESDLDQFGYANSFVGDINHDGFDDIICSAAYRNEFKKWEGKAYLILGDSTGWSDTDQVAQKAVASFVYPLEEAVVGYSVAGVGDVNHDGTPDFVIGVPGANMACLILGRPAVDWGQNFDLTNADYKFTGEYEGDYAGSWISFANDVNHDGYADFLISAIQSFFNGGRIYLILGRDHWSNSEVPLMLADGSFIGEDVETHTGFCTSGLKDYDGDGYDDFLIGARYLNGPYPHSGKMYLIKGKPGAWERDYNLEQVPTYFWGDDSITCAGWQVADVGDVNGDNAHDIVTSGPFNSTGAHWGGKIYFFYGKNITYNIDGYVRYYSKQQPVRDVKLLFSGLQPDSVFTNADGKYTFSTAPGQTYLAIPFRKPEDNQNYLISAYDAALVARYVVELDTLNQYQRRVADVDQDNKIAMYDAAQIARFAVSLPPLGSSNIGEYYFDPPNRIYDNVKQSYQDQNYLAMIVGDVDGSWQPLNPARRKTLPLTSMLPKSIVGVVNAKVSVPVQLHRYEAAIAADIQVRYDPEQLEFVEIEKTTLSGEFNLIYNATVPGEIKVAMYTTMPTDLDGEFVRFVFKAIRRGNNEVTRFEVERLRINDLAPVTGATTILLVDKKNLQATIELTNQPNPFNPTTRIYFQNVRAGKAKLVIYDMLGKQVRLFELGHLAPGTHEQFWDGKNNEGVELSSGVYFVKFICGNDIKISKMIKLK